MFTLQYDNTHMQDGCGAQYQRIIGIICIAREVNAPFSYVSPIWSGCSEIEWKSVESFFNLKCADTEPSGDQYLLESRSVVSLDNPSLQELEYLKHIGLKGKATIRLPYSMVEPDAGAVYSKHLPYIRSLFQHPPYEFDSAITNIAIHIRLGDVVHTHKNEATIPGRFTPMEHYQQLISAIQSKRKQGTYLIHIYSQDHPLLDCIRGEANVQLHLDEDLATTLSHMMKADELFTSKSSFSYLAGLCSPNTVYYMPFWHPPLSHWKTFDVNGNFLYL